MSVECCLFCLCGGRVWWCVEYKNRWAKIPTEGGYRLIYSSLIPIDTCIRRLSKGHLTVRKNPWFEVGRK